MCRRSRHGFSRARNRNLLLCPHLGVDDERVESVYSEGHSQSWGARDAWKDQYEDDGTDFVQGCDMNGDAKIDIVSVLS